MLNRAIRNTGKFFNPILGDIIWAVVTFFALVIANYFDILKLKKHFPEWAIPFIYIVFVLFSFVVLVFLLNLIKLVITGNKLALELVEVNNIDKYIIHDSQIGFLYGVGIKLHNEGSNEIFECFGTLETLQQVYINKKNKLIFKNIELGKVGVSSSGNLRWANHDFYDVEHKESIPAKSKEKIIQVSNIISVAEVVKKGKKQELKQDDVKYFDFSLCGSNIRNWRIPGLYKVRVRINGKIANNSEIQNVIEYFEGYVYSYVISNTFDIYWVKNPLRDGKIINDPRVIINSSKTS